MKKTVAFLFLSSFLLTFFSPSATAEDITFNGEPDKLGTVMGLNNSLFPKQSLSGNTVTALGGTADFVFGGLSDSGKPVSGNTVNMHGGDVTGDIFGGFSWSNSGPITVTANNNTVNMYGGKVTGGIFGGYGIANSGTGTANNNTVNIHGGEVTESIIGGFSHSASGTSTATHNTIRIAEAASLGSNLFIYGGSASGRGNFFTGNTLHIAGKHTIRGLANFQYLNFTLPAGFAAGDTLITANDVSLGGASTVSSINSAGSTSLNVGDTVKLVSATGSFTGSIANNTATGMGGISTLYEWENVGMNSQTLSATLSGKRVNPQTHAFLQGRTASLALLNQGGDLLAGNGIKSIRDTVSRGGVSFVAMQGGSSRYDSGSHVDLDSFSLMAGAAWGNRLAAADLYLGAFVETGTGSYSSYNAFTGMAAVRNKGNADYIGLGLSGELLMDNGAYANAAIRAGRVNADLSSDLVPAATLSSAASYDSSGSLYMGAHLQGGWIMKLTGKDSLDAYVRYVFTHMDSDTVTIAADRFRFASSDSHRFRGGLRYAHDTGGLFPFAGIAYEYEADGKAEGTAAGWRIKPTDMGGATFIGEVGLSWEPKSSENIRLDLAIEGFAGQRDGVMGNMRFNYHF